MTSGAGHEMRVEEPMLAPYIAVNEMGRGPVLVLAPHPDDEVFGCAGAILRHVGAGEAVTVVVVTDGGAFTDNRSETVAIRRAESINASKLLGYQALEFWELEDRTTAYVEALTCRIEEKIRQCGAKLVYMTSPTDLHPDHRAVGLCGLEAVRRVGHDVSAVLYEIGSPLPRPNRLLDLTELLERKRETIACFGSQLRRQRYAMQIEALNRFRTYTLPPHVVASEAYRVVPAGEIGLELRRMLAADAQLGVLPVANEHELPLVSVIVLAPGDVDVSGALDSIAGQRYPRIEVVVVSTGPGTPVLGPWCGSHPVRTVGADTVRSRGAALNLGVENARGALVTFLAHDAWFYPHHIQTLQAQLARHGSAKVASAGVESISRSVDGSRGPVRAHHEPIDATALLLEPHAPMVSPLVDRSLFTEARCRFDEMLEGAEEADLYLQLLHKVTFVHTKEIGLGRPATPHAPANTEVLLGKWVAKWSSAELASVWEGARAQLSQLSQTTRQTVDALKTAQAENTSLREAVERGASQVRTLETQRQTQTAAVEAGEKHVRAELERMSVALAQVTDERDRLWSSAAQRGARLVGRFSPGLQRSVGKVVKAFLPGGLMTANALAAQTAAPAPAPEVTAPEPPPTRPAVSWGDFRRTSPISMEWGFDRGTPIDRFYCDAFLSGRGGLITGRVLEVQRDQYASRFGTNIERVDTFDIVDTFKPTYRCDLSALETSLPVAAYDCVLVPFTLHLVPGIENAIRHLIRALKPTGVMLCTMSVLTRSESPGDHDFWHLPLSGWRVLLDRVVPEAGCTLTAYGNSLTAISGLMGLAAEELDTAELELVDPRFQVMVGLEARPVSATAP